MTHNLLPHIYITANKQSGKTTIANLLVNEFGYKKLSFAYAVKKLSAIIIKQLTNSELSIETIIEYIDNGEIPKDSPVIIEDFNFWNGVRPILQGVGDGARDVISSCVWIDTLMTEIQANSHQPIVIDDCRYPNEATHLRSFNFIGIFIDKPGSDTEHITEHCQKNHMFGKIPAELVIDYYKGEENAKEVVRKFIKSGTASIKAK